MILSSLLGSQEMRWGTGGLTHGKAGVMKTEALLLISNNAVKINSI